jgi:hypothetical protein
MHFQLTKCITIWKMAHFVKNHLVGNHIDDPKSGGSLHQMYQQHFGIFAFELQDGDEKCKGMKKRTRGG